MEGDRGRAELFRLFGTEREFIVRKYYDIDNTDMVTHRRKAFEYIKKQSRSCEYPLIPFLAMTYFDLFFSTKGRTEYFSPYTFELFLNCCLTLAWKLESDNFKLTNYLDEKNLNYKNTEVTQMELKISIHLQWRIQTLTPFRFVEFLIPIGMLPPTLESPLRSSVRVLIFDAQIDLACAKCRPSVLAASAVLTVASKICPSHLLIIKNHIFSIESFGQSETAVDKYKSKLEPLYKDEAAVGGVVMGQTGPVPVAEDQPSSGAMRDPIAEQSEIIGETSSSAPKEESDPSASQDPDQANQITVRTLYSSDDEKESQEPAATSGDGSEAKDVQPNAEDHYACMRCCEIL